MENVPTTNSKKFLATIDLATASTPASLATWPTSVTRIAASPAPPTCRRVLTLDVKGVKNTPPLAWVRHAAGVIDLCVPTIRKEKKRKCKTINLHFGRPETLRNDVAFRFRKMDRNSFLSGGFHPIKLNPRTRTQEGHESNPRNRTHKDTNRPACQAAPPTATSTTTRISV